MIKTGTTVAFLMFLLFSATARAVVTFDWATIENPGNASDDTGFGAVSYVYRISKHEVTNAQYTQFLNAVDPAGNNVLSLYNTNMSSDATGGIQLNIAAPNGSKYQSKPGRESNPVVWVSFFDAMRFVNWLENGQGNASTESGAYAIGTGLNETRSPNARYFIPSEDEWYKAAYHRNDGVTANYWDYPTSTNAVPYSDQPPGSDAPMQSNTANFFRDDGVSNGYDDGYALTGSTIFSNTENYLSDVGAYTASASPYGVFDLGGNVSEFNEAGDRGIFGSLINRRLRGGTWSVGSFLLSASVQSSTSPSGELFNFGFRVASIPEPNSLLLGVVSMLALLQRRRCFATVR